MPAIPLSYSTRAPVAIPFWILFCVYCNCAGWALSLVRQLNASGYLVAFTPVVLALFGWATMRRARCIPRSWVQRTRRRFRRPFALAFLVLATMAFAGGVLYAPTNYDALAYRTPRILNWLAEGHWHWIQTEFNRLNTRAFGFEWLATPLIALTGTDRFLFLINVTSFLLMPGLIFSAFTRLGVRPRAAWHWMWLVPTGYSFLLQAGGVANDLFGAVFALAAVDFALRARTSKRTQDLWLSILAAALMTGSKASNLPLLLPWVIALVPSLKLLPRKPLVALAVVLVAVPSSLAPLVVINLKHSGDWTGIRAENVPALEHASLVNVANNAVLLTIQNLAPPVFPVASKWNKAVEHAVPSSWRAKLERAFEPGGAHWTLGELQIEEAAGIGFGISMLLLASLAAGRCFSARPLIPGASPGRYAKAVLAGVFVALLAFMVKSGLSGAARLITPYYALLIPAALLSPAQTVISRARWWQLAAGTVLVMAGLLVILSPSRPLWPANLVLSKTGARGGVLARAKAVYQVFSERADGFAPARSLLPPDERVLGLISTDDPETSLWRPFGSRRVIHVTRADSRDGLCARNVHYILLNSRKLEMAFQKPFETWLKEMNGEVLTTIRLALRVTDGPSDWCLVKLPCQR